MKTWQTTLITGLITAFLAVFFIWPLAETLQGAFVFNNRPTLAFFYEVFANPLYMEGLRNSLALAVITTGMVILLALPPAWLAARFEFPGKTLLTGLILVPLILPPFVGAIGIRQILGQFGVLNAILVKCGMIEWAQARDWLGAGQFWAVAVTTALHLYPIFYLNAVAAIANVDPSLEEAAANLGCPGWRRFFKITLPLIMPGLFAGGILVFIWSFTELGAPLMFDYTRVMSVQIFDGIKDIGTSPFPYALVVVMLVCSAVLYALARFLFGINRAGMAGKSSVLAVPSRLSGMPGLAACAIFLTITATAVVPHVGVILSSVSQAWYRAVLPTSWTLDWYQIALGHSLTLPSIRNSLFYAALAMLADLALGIAVAVIIVRGTARWRGALDTLTMLPLAVPGIVLAFGYIAMSQPGRILAFINPAQNPTTLLIVAYAIRRLPYVVRAAVAGLQQTPIALEEAAANLGASPAHTMRRITLPLITAHLAGGAILAFSFAMLEVSDSIMLAQKQIYFPITKALFELSQLLGDGPYLAAALGVWAMIFLGITLLLANRLLGKKLGAVFRI